MLSHKFQKRLHACTVIAKAKLVKPDLLVSGGSYCSKVDALGEQHGSLKADVRGPRGRGHRGPRGRGHPSISRDTKIKILLYVIAYDMARLKHNAKFIVRSFD